MLRLNGFHKTVAVGTADQIVLPVDEGRHCVLLFAAQGSIWVRFGEPMTATGLGFLVPFQDKPLYLSEMDVGALIKSEIHAIAAAAGSQLSYVEGRH